MSKKDYERAARLVQILPAEDREAATTVFEHFFRDDNERFDCGRFRRACVPGANVRASGRVRCAGGVA